MEKQGFIVDLDGTLYRGNERLPYAVEFVQSVRRSGSPLLFMTNNSTRTPEEVAEHLRELDIQAHHNEVFTSSQAAVRYLEEDGRGRKVFCIGEEGLVAALINAGYELADHEADYVLQGLDRKFHYDKLHTALRLISNGAAFIQTNPDVRLPVDGGFLPGAGSIGAAIATATDAAPVIIGKPSRIMMGFALERLGLPASSVWMVGDNMRTDMAAGYSAGCKTALLLTGVTNRENLKELEAEVGFRCDFVGGDLSELTSFLQMF